MPLTPHLVSIFGRHGIAIEKLDPPEVLPVGCGDFAVVRSELMAIDGRLTLAVIPAGRVVDVIRVARDFGAREVELADEDELHDVCAECTSRMARAPFGNFCGLAVVLDAELCRSSKLIFGEPIHGGAVRVLLIDFLKLFQPRVMEVSSSR